MIALGPDPLLPTDLQQRLSSELRPGERVLWSARPRARAAVLPTLLIMAFGVVFAGMPLAFFVIPAFTKDNGHGPPAAFGLFGLIFVAVGVFIAFTPLFAFKTAKRTVYAVTNQRALIVSPRGFGGWTTQTFQPGRLTGMTRTERADGSGSLVFEQFIERRGSGTTTVSRGFTGIDRVRDVETLITTTLLTGHVRATD